MNGIASKLVDATNLGRGENAFVDKNQNHYGLSQVWQMTGEMNNWIVMNNYRDKGKVLDLDSKSQLYKYSMRKT